MATSDGCQSRGPGSDDIGRDHNNDDKQEVELEIIDPSIGSPMVDDYSSESDVDTEPAKAFHRKISTYKEIKATVRKEGGTFFFTSSIGLFPFFFLLGVAIVPLLY